LRIAQEAETPVCELHDGSLSWRLAYARAEESRAVNEPGQDYLTLARTDNSLVFALCDGVGQSFRGNLASTFLGDSLIDWLVAEVPSTFDSADVQAGLTNHLKELTGEASDYIRRQTLPTHLPQVVLAVLREKQGLGSESTFVCGRLDEPDQIFPQGRLTLAWLGDSRLRLWRSHQERTTGLADTFRASERWSTRRGPLNSPPHVLVSPLVLREEPRLSDLCLIAYSDGLADLDTFELPPSVVELEILMEDLRARPLNDDMSFIQIWLAEPPAELVVRW
jgi:hypothetical protein